MERQTAAAEGCGIATTISMSSSRGRTRRATLGEGFVAAIADCEKSAQNVVSLDYVQIHMTAHRVTQWMGRGLLAGMPIVFLVRC